MKKYFITAAAVLLLYQSIYAQNRNPFAKEQPNAPQEQLNAIDKVKDEIKRSIGTFQKKEKYIDTTGYRNAYFNGNELQLISAYYKDTTTVKHVDWYFQNGQLIFSMKLWTDRKTNDTLDYERFYLSNEQLIGWFKFETRVDRNRTEFWKLNVRMRDYIDDLKGDNRK